MVGTFNQLSCSHTFETTSTKFAFSIKTPAVNWTYRALKRTLYGSILKAYCRDDASRTQVLYSFIDCYQYVNNNIPMCNVVASIILRAHTRAQQSTWKHVPILCLSGQCPCRRYPYSCTHVLP